VRGKLTRFEKGGNTGERLCASLLRLSCGTLSGGKPELYCETPVSARAGTRSHTRAADHGRNETECAGIADRRAGNHVNVGPGQGRDARNDGTEDVGKPAGR